MTSARVQEAKMSNITSGGNLLIIELSELTIDSNESCYIAKMLCNRTNRGFILLDDPERKLADGTIKDGWRRTQAKSLCYRGAWKRG
jgi:hypothetical protein